MSVVVMGVCGSGKTTVGQRLAQSLGWPFIEGDRLHPPRNVAHMSAGLALSDEDRWPWLDAIAAAIAAEQQRGGEAVAACSALKRAYRERLQAAAGPLMFVHLDGDQALLAQRMAKRKGHFMPPDLLTSQLATLEPPSPDEPAMVLDAGLDPEILVARIRTALASPLAKEATP